MLIIRSELTAYLCLLAFKSLAAWPLILWDGLIYGLRLASLAVLV